MSPDDIFAAQFWPWPDPAIKRDAQGRILFVNAAFLGLYGGRVEDWRGNAVGGWPAPQAAPYRFETRLPDANGVEQVYDWMEQALSDGNSFALARNVTVFTQSPEPDPAGVFTQPQEPVDQAQHQAEHHEPQMAQSYQAETARAQADAVQWDQAPERSPAQSYDAEPLGTSNESAGDIHSDPIPVPEIEIPEIDIPSDEAYALSDSSAAEEALALDRQPEPEPEREFERRALPIESGSAVLGNNWRDAVIAKAIGADGVTETHDAEPETETVQAGPQGEDQNGPIRILLAEDNAINPLLTRTLLEADGHTVETVEDGVLAVEAMKTAKFDLIFMDMRMPNMDGLEATRKIRALPNVSKALPIVALTANAFDDDRNACFDSGMNDFMTKPVSAEELSEKVNDWTSEEAKARMMKAA
jgi:CheY-like chemotaxis protein